jgi:DNA-directed RNA polymerase subunit beta'
METTVGQLLLNESLPEDLRDYRRSIDKKSLQALFTELAEKHPDQYSEVNQKLHELSADAVTGYGGIASLSLESMRAPLSVDRARGDIRLGVEKILAGPGAPKEKNDKVVELIASKIDELTKLNYDEGVKEKNPLALQILSGSRGSASQFRSLRAGDLMVVDHKDRPIPIPMLTSYAEGLDPVEYWSGAYGARKGSISTKFATPKAGFLGKQLSMAAHRLIVTEKDCGTANGIPVDASDPDNEGAVLAQGQGEYKAGAVLTPTILRKIGTKTILARSPITCQAEKGVCQRCAGVRERGDFPPLGDNIGVAAAQAISEPIGQGQLSVKHTGGLASGAKREIKSGLDLVNQLVQVPETFQGGAAISTVDGRVEVIENAPQGGQLVTVGGIQHWVPPGESLAIKKGDMMEAGDVLSSGIPNPYEVTQYKGIGEGRRYFADLFSRTLRENKFPAHRRNVELLSRGLINHVRITDLDGPADTVPDDVVEYDDVTRGYQPRYGFKTLVPKAAVGLYLESPALHYSIGTRVTPRVAKRLEEYGIGNVTAHADEPSFVPEMTRAMETLSHSSDWMVRLGGFHLKKGLGEAVQRNRVAETHGTSYIPALAQGVEFGKPPKGEGY